MNVFVLFERSTLWDCFWVTNIKTTYHSVLRKARLIIFIKINCVKTSQQKKGNRKNGDSWLKASTKEKWQNSKMSMNTFEQCRTKDDFKKKPLGAFSLFNTFEFYVQCNSMLNSGLSKIQIWIPSNCREHPQRKKLQLENHIIFIMRCPLKEFLKCKNRYSLFTVNNYNFSLTFMSPIIMVIIVT